MCVLVKNKELGGKAVCQGRRARGNGEGCAMGPFLRILYTTVYTGREHSTYIVMVVL
jgi:hypothetical protein